MTLERMRAARLYESTRVRLNDAREPPSDSEGSNSIYAVLLGMD
ncbi:MAG: hypothetical protein ACT4P6_06615 [Gemmatimonadaceae bacterium]